MYAGAGQPRSQPRAYLHGNEGPVALPNHHGRRRPIQRGGNPVRKKFLFCGVILYLKTRTFAKTGSGHNAGENWGT